MRERKACHYITLIITPFPNADHGSDPMLSMLKCFMSSSPFTYVLYSMSGSHAANATNWIGVGSGSGGGGNHMASPAIILT